MLLHEFGSQVWHAFGTPPCHVGSSLTQKSGWRDVDARLILSDEEYAALGLGKPNLPRQSGNWVALCLAFSALGAQMTGLPIDFQIQQQSRANAEYDGPRSMLGAVALRFSPQKEACGPFGPRSQKEASMFLSICRALNRMHLAWLAALLRCLCSLVLHTWSGEYQCPDEIGYRGWIDSRLGTLAFRRMDGGIQWRW